MSAPRIRVRTTRPVHSNCMACGAEFEQKTQGRRRLFCELSQSGVLPKCLPMPPAIIPVKSTWWVRDFGVRRVA